MSLAEKAAERARREEETWLEAYLDKKNLWTTATGFNLERDGAAADLSAIGLNARDIWSEIERSRRIGLKQVKRPWGVVKCTHLPVVTVAQAEQLLVNDIAATIADLHRLVPTFDKLPEPAQLCLVDMAFNMGPSAIRGFMRHTIPSIVKGNYEEAARFIEASDYARHDVPARAARNVALLRRLA